MQNKAVFASTQSYERVVAVYNTSLIVVNPENTGIKIPKSLPINAIWDTGATMTTIRYNIAEFLGLKPISMSTTSTANGIAKCYLYYVDLMLPNKVLVKNILIMAVEKMSVDALIGADVIMRGDFAITNLNGKTKVTFRMPSVKEIDFVKEIKNN